MSTIIYFFVKAIVFIIDIVEVFDFILRWFLQ